MCIIVSQKNDAAVKDVGLTAKGENNSTIEPVSVLLIVNFSLSCTWRISLSSRTDPFSHHPPAINIAVEEPHISR